MNGPIARASRPQAVDRRQSDANPRRPPFYAYTVETAGSTVTLTAPDRRDAQPESRGGGAWLRSSSQGDRLTVELGGQWTTRGLGTAGRDFRALQPRHHKRLTLRLKELSLLDTTGAWILHSTRRRLEREGLTVTLEGASETIAGMLATVAAHDQPCPPEPKRAPALTAAVGRLGKGVIDSATTGAALVSFMGLVFLACLRALLVPWRLRWTALANQIEEAGLNALPIVALINFLFGVVIAFLSAAQLANFGAQILTVNVVAVGVLREMAIVLTAIIIAGRSGSAYTAQIGTMKVNEEIDALQTIGLDPVAVLVVPRVLGLLIVLPLLVVFADLLGILGGAVMATATLDISLLQFMRQLEEAAQLQDFLVGLVKAPLFAIIIAVVGCFEGFRVSRSAESVGRQTTRSVVVSISLVIVMDGVLAVFFSIIGV